MKHVPLLSYRAMRAKHPRLSTESMQRLGFDVRGRPLAIDGKAGKLTRGGSYFDPDEIIEPIGSKALGELLAGAKEEGGNNSGPFVAKYYRSRDARKDHGAWCAAFASWCLGCIYPDAPYKWGARRLVLALTRVALPDIKPGDMLAWDRRSSKSKFAGHVAIVIARGCSWIYVIDGNVGVDGAVRVRRYDREAPHRSKTSRFLYAGRYMPDEDE